MASGDGQSKLENQPERPIWITVICLQRLHWRCLYQERKGMKCLCCGKPITNSATNVEKEWCWHKKCVKRFFQTDELPILDITKEQLEILATETVNEGLTVPGSEKAFPAFINRS